MSAHSEITDLINSYARMLDAGDIDGVAALFENATWRSGATGVVLTGAEKVRGVYEQVKLYNGSPRTKHLISNLSIRLSDSRSSATSECYFTVLQGGDPGDAIQVILCGRYIDRFERVDGRWRLADRLFITDLTGDLSKHFS